jgi:hypothetical protein
MHEHPRRDNLEFATREGEMHAHHGARFPAEVRAKLCRSLHNLSGEIN